MIDNIILYKNKRDCCGCGACMNICPKNAISMIEDKYGFLYPNIEESLCVRCGECKKICAYQKENVGKNPLKVFAGISENTNVINSASGGIFAGLALSILNENGIVYGVSMENIKGSLTPMHIGIEKKEDLYKLQGSKYVQSYTGNIYRKVLKELKDNRLVLFSGTPCQIDALKSFLKKDYNNLLTVDIICHGVPNIKFFQDYIKILEKKLNGNILNFKFRDKDLGWGLNAKIVYKSNNGNIKEKIIPAGESSYYKLFLNSDIYRENCYYCKYANSKRMGDITIGDFWGINIEHPELIKENKLNEKNGVSCILINTTNGEKYINKYSNNLTLYNSTFDKVRNHNKQLNSPSQFSNNREEILDIYNNYGYDGIEAWFRKKRGFKLYIIKLKNKIKIVLNKIR